MTRLLSERELMFVKHFQLLALEDQIRVEAYMGALLPRPAQAEVTEKRQSRPNIVTLLTFPKKTA